MKIGIDISPALGEPSGFRRCLESFLDALSRVDAENEYHLCAYFWRGFPERAHRANLPKAGNFRLHVWHLPQSLLFTSEYFLRLRILERRLEPLGLDVFHGPAANLPRLSRARSVVTIQHLDSVGEGYSLFDRFYFNTLPKDAALRADRVITVSEHSRGEIIRSYGLPPDRVRTVYSGGAFKEFREEGDGRAPALAGLRKPYYLFVSAFNARKNLPVLLEAFSRCRRSGSRHQLVLVGRVNDYARGLSEQCARLGIADDALFAGTMDAEGLRPLYQQADAMVYPSLIEGFGLPLLEAMACGAPVIAARASCLPEIGGDACLYFDPRDPEALAAAMRRVASDEALRGELSSKGRARAREFSWERNARETLEVYRSLAG